MYPGVDREANSGLKRRNTEEEKGIPPVGSVDRPYKGCQQCRRPWRTAISFATAGSACFSNVIEFRLASRAVPLVIDPRAPLSVRRFATQPGFRAGIGRREKLARRTFLQNFTFAPRRGVVPRGQETGARGDRYLGGLNSFD